MRLHQAILFLALLSSSNQHDIVKRETKEKRVVCYYTNWSVYRPGTAKFNPQNINPYLCTHLIYAFGGLDRENGLRPYDKYQDIEQGGYAKFTGLKTYNKALKTMLAIGGWNEGSARFSPLVADEERRKVFVKNVVKFLRVNHFDGLDLDWEYPAFRDGGKLHDKENYAQLVQELREEFERESSKTGRIRLLLTMAVPAGLEYIDKGYDIQKLNQYLDFMNILSYDYHSAFEPSVNHHSPLYSLEEESEYNFDAQLTIDATVKHYIMKGADADKLVLGIPTYGRSYTLFNEGSTDLGSPADGPGEQGDATREKGYLAYYEICSKVKDGWSVEQPKDTAMGPYAYKGNQWVGYDDENIVRKKSQYVNEKQLGGIMFWSIDNDDFRGSCHKRPYPLIEAAKEILLGKVPSKPSSGPRTSKTSSSKSNKLKNHRTTSVAPTQATPTITTPDPPTTPDPGSDFVCKDEGFFPHPRDCKKYFWCLDSGPSNLGIVAHQFTCPSGLFFNKAADSCDFARNVLCNKKSTTTTTTTTSATTKATSKVLSGKGTTHRTTTTTTTTTTTEPPPPEEQEEDYEDSEEDPQTIKQLINLIKKLGGVAELERQLEGNSGSDATTPSISKSLYDRVINKGPPKYQTLQRNGPSGPQNEGLPRETVRASYRRDKPQYVTIRRERPSTTTESLNSAEYADVYEVDDGIPEEGPKYKNIVRSKSNEKENVPDLSELQPKQPKAERHFRPKYQPIERFRAKQHQQQPEDKEEGSTLKYTNLIRSRATSIADHTSSTSKYVTLHRQRPQLIPQIDELVTTENYVLDDEEEVTEEQIPLDVTTTSSTTRPRLKVSALLATTPRILTSTRVVTQVVEGSTQRQRVPLHKLHELLNSDDNLIKSSPKSNPSMTTTTKKRIINRLFRKRPITLVEKGTTTENPLQQQSNQQIRPPVAIVEDNKPTNFTNTAQKRVPGFIPGRIRSRPNIPGHQQKEQEGKASINHVIRRFRSTTVKVPLEENNEEGRFISHQKSATESNRHHGRSRFFKNRSTTTSTEDNAHEDDSEPLLTREFSRETSIVRRPISKRRRLSTTETVSTTSTEITTVISEKSESTSNRTELKGKINQTNTETSTEQNVKNFEENRTILQENTTLHTPLNRTRSRQHKSNDASFTATYSTSTEPYTTILLNNTKHYPDQANETSTETLSTQPFSTTIGDTIQESNQLIPQTVGRNKTRRVLRKKILVNEKRNIITAPPKVQSLRAKDKSRIIIIRRPSNKTHTLEKNKFETSKLRITTTTTDASQKKVSSRGKTKFNHSAQNKGVVVEDIKRSTTDRTVDTKAGEVPAGKRKRILIRSKKKFPENKEEKQVQNVESTEAERTQTSPLQKRENGKVRRVVIKKTIKDLAVGESGLSTRPEENIIKVEEEVKKKNVSRGTLKLKDSLEEFIGNKDGNITSEIARHRRPFNKRLISRGTSTTTSTTAQPQTTTRQRTTAQTLRQRLNKFRIDKSIPKSSVISTADGGNRTSHPRKGEFRRVIRPVVSSQSVAEDSQLGESYSRSVSKDTNIRYEKGQFFPNEESDTLVITEESQKDGFTDEEIVGEVTDEVLIGPSITVNESASSGESVEDEKEHSSSLPDLANVAVAAIQSLATSAPTVSTEKYKTTAGTHAPPKDLITTRQRPSRPPRPFRPSTTPTGTPKVRTSSPRPFTRPAPHSHSTSTPTRALSPAPHRTSVIYEDYDADYYAEPVDVPLSGKVRIHSDGYIECLDIGNFPHPFSCRKFISCAKMENGRLLGWEYTCPKGLSFDPIGGICNWNAGLGCKE